MTHSEWFDSLTDGDSTRTVATKVDFAHTTVSRQVAADNISPEMVIALCRAYGRSPVTGLVETGYIAPYETEGVSIPFALEQATNQQILDEIMRRSDPEARYLFRGDEDTIDLADDAQDAEVFDFPTTRVDPVGDDGVPEQAVAYSGPDEDALRQEDEDGD